MSDNTLYSAVLLFANTKYPSAYKKIEEDVCQKVLNRMRDRITYNQQQGKMHHDAYSNTFRINPPSAMELVCLKNMGFEVEEPSDTSNGINITIPKKVQGSPMTKAQELFDSHVEQMNQLLVNLLEKHEDHAKSHCPHILSFTNTLLEYLSNGTFNVTIISETPKIMSISIQEELNHNVWANNYAHFNQLLWGGEVLEHYIWNRLYKELVLESDFRISIKNVRVGASSPSFYLELHIQL